MQSILARIRAAIVSFAVALIVSPPAISQDQSPPAVLVKAAVEIQKHLDSMPQPHQSDWKLYLDWDKWGPQLASGKMEVPETLQEIHSRFYGVYDGLDHPTFLNLRNELRNLLNESVAGENPGAHPGVLIRFNKRVVSAALDNLTRSRFDQRETGNWIAGAWVTGTAISQAHVSGRLVPFDKGAAVEVRVQGTVTSPHTIAHNGSFQVHGSANSQFDGVSYLYLDKDEIRMTEPTFSVQTNSQLSHVDGPRLLSGIAFRKAQQRRGQGESEGEAIIASKAAQELKNDLALEINRANGPFSDDGPYHTLLIRTDLVPAQITTGLSATAAEVGLRFPGGAVAQSPPKRELSSDVDFEIAIHESSANAFTTNFLRGSWWTDLSFTRVQRELTGGNTNEMLIGATPQRWRVRWDWARPLSAKITAEALEYELSFAQAKIDDKEIEGGLLVRARYQPSAPRWGLEFRRVGAVEVRSNQPGHPLPPEVAEFFTRKFSALFDETVHLDGLSPPAGGGWDGLAAYAIAGVTLDDGWFAIQCQKARSP